MISDVTLAYFAGMIDADGYISIQRSVRKGVPYYGPTVGIAGTRREPHDVASYLWGGKVTCYDPKNPNHKPQFQWSRIGGTAIEIIRSLEPFLLIKGPQAQLAISLWDHIQCSKSDDPFPWFGPDYDFRVEADNMRLEMIDMNQSRNRIRSASTLDLLRNPIN